MQVRISHNADEMAALLDAVGRRQVPFATANGINRTTEEIQRGARQKLPSQLRFRSEKSRRFMEQLIHIGRADRATKTNLVGIVGIQDPFGKAFKGKAGILAKFQQGGRRVARNSSAPLSIPTTFARQDLGEPLPRRYYPKNLRLEARRQISGGYGQQRVTTTQRGGFLLRGKLRTYAINPVFHSRAPQSTWGVWQRRGRGRNSEIFLLWVYRWSIPVPKRISFLEDAQALAQQRLKLNIEGQMVFARDELKQYRARLLEKAARAKGRL